jgi:hypothetical protein
VLAIYKRKPMNATKQVIANVLNLGTVLIEEVSINEGNANMLIGVMNYWAESRDEISFGTRDKFLAEGNYDVCTSQGRQTLTTITKCFI